MKTQKIDNKRSVAAPTPAKSKVDELIIWLVALVIGGYFIYYQFFSTSTNDTQTNLARTFIQKDIDAGLTAYHDNTGSYPTTRQGLQALIEKPAGVANWQGPYIKGVDTPKDPWGGAYQYSFPGKHNGAEKPDVWSNGADKKIGTADDIVNW